MKVIPVVEDFAGIAAAMKDPGLPEGTGVAAMPQTSVVEDYAGIARAVQALEAERTASWLRFTEAEPQATPVEDDAGQDSSFVTHAQTCEERIRLKATTNAELAIFEGIFEGLLSEYQRALASDISKSAAPLHKR